MWENNKIVKGKLKTYDIIVGIVVLVMFGLSFVFWDGMFVYFAVCTGIIMFVPVRISHERFLKEKYKHNP